MPKKLKRLKEKYNFSDMVEGITNEIDESENSQIEGEENDKPIVKKITKIIKMSPMQRLLPNTLYH